MGEGIEETKLRGHLGREQDSEQAEIPDDSAERDVEPALDEEEWR